MPPSDVPSTWADSQPSASSTATASAAMSEIRYGAARRGAASIAEIDGVPSHVRCVDAPASRLSKRAVVNPAAANSVSRPSGQ